MKAEVVVIEGRNKGYSVPVAHECTIGRDPSCELQIFDDRASRRHCRLRGDADGYSVEDLSSRNGTFVNEESIERCRVFHLDVIRCGGTRVKILCPEFINPRKSGVDLTETGLGWNRRPIKTRLEKRINTTLASVLGGTQPGGRETAVRFHQEMVTVYDLCETIARQSSAEDLFQALLQSLDVLIPFERIAFFRYNRSTDHIMPQIHRRSPSDPVGQNFRIGGRTIEKCCREGLSIGWIDAEQGRHALAAPIEGQERILGAVYLEVKGSGLDSDLERQCYLMSAVCRQAGLALERCELIIHGQHQRYQVEEMHQEAVAAAEALQVEDRKFRALVEGLPGGVVLFDSMGVVMLANGIGQQRMEEVCQVDDEGRVTAIAGIDRAERLESMRAARHEEEYRTPEKVYSIAINRISVGERPLDTRAISADDSPQSRYLFVLVFDETTQAKALEEQLRHSQKLESLGILAGGIAHDFNNLLQVILGNTGLALEQVVPETKVGHCLDQIRLAAEQASSLTNQMMAYSGKKKFDFRTLDLPKVVDEMAHLLEVSISKSVTLDLDFASGTPPVEGDPTQLRQVVMNLITNASEAVSSEGGRVELGTGSIEADRALLSRGYFSGDLKEGTYAFLRVCDDGNGMDESTMARIFDPFFSTKFTGRGLGLSTVLGIVRGHRGTVVVESEVGKGTSFLVLLPRAEVGRVQPTSTRLIRPQAWRGEGKILVVDDEPSVRSIVRRTLEHFGFEVLVAEDGEEAVSIFAENHEAIRVVLLDLTMPRKDGVRTFEEMRQIREDACVILSSGYSEQDFSNRFSGSGFAGFIQKPYMPTVLIETLRKVLEG